MECGFPYRPNFFTHFLGVRYHLQDFHGQGHHPKNANELFNLRHASLRNTIERLFGILKSRFTIFKTAPRFLYNTQSELGLACAGLHNFIRKEYCSNEFPLENDNEISTSSHALTNQEEDFEPCIDNREQQRDIANERRVGIATDMWSNVEHMENTEY